MSWHEVALGTAIRVKHGFAFKSQYFSDSGEFVVLTPGNFNEEGGFRLRPGKDRFYAGDIPEAYVLDEGDLIVAMTEQGPGLLGSSALIPEGGKYLHNQRLGLVQEIDAGVLDKRFLYYLFNTRPVRGQISGSATGTKVRHTAPERLYQVKVTVPTDVNQQRRIASILSAYDDLIENNRRRIQLLEQAAWMVYKEWFVRLRFPGHEHVKTKDGVPEGWEQGTVGERTTLVRGKSYKSSELVEFGGKPFVNLKCIARHGGFRLDGLKRFSGKYRDNQVLVPGDIVIALTDMTRDRHIVAHPARVPRAVGEDAVFSMDTVKLDPDDTVDKSWFYHFLRYSGFSKKVREHATGTNVLHLNSKQIENHEFHCPPLSVQKEYGETVRGFLAQQDNLIVQSEKLARTRDLLLSHLITGRTVSRGKNLLREGDAMTTWTNKSVLSFAAGADPVEKIQEQAREWVLKAIEAGWKGPPYNPIEIGKQMGATVEPSYDIADARTILRGDRSVIEFNPSQPRERVRFSIAHEVAHLLFPDVSEEVRHRGGIGTNEDAWQLEMLCNLAASEFVMPIGSLQLDEELKSIEEIMVARKRYDVSAEAFMIRMAKTANRSIGIFCASPHLNSEANVRPV